MEERGRLLYEEKIADRRAQAELNTNHIGLFMGCLVLIITWTVYGYKVSQGIELLWVVVGLLVSLILTVIGLFTIDRLLRLEFTRNLPIKVYEEGILMPTTRSDRVLWRKPPFIHENDLDSLRLIIAHNPDHKDMLIATTKHAKSYPKMYDRNSREARNIIEIVDEAFHKVKAQVNE